MYRYLSFIDQWEYDGVFNGGVRVFTTSQATMGLGERVAHFISA